VPTKSALEWARCYVDAGDPFTAIRDRARPADRRGHADKRGPSRLHLRRRGGQTLESIGLDVRLEGRVHRGRPALCVMSGGSFNLVHATGAVPGGGVHAPPWRGSLKPSPMAPTWSRPGSKHRRHTAEAGPSGVGSEVALRRASSASQSLRPEGLVPGRTAHSPALRVVEGAPLVTLAGGPAPQWLEQAGFVEPHRICTAGPSASPSPRVGNARGRPIA
jgi:hypothetical protein